jgi:hypothetical protein
LDDIHDGDWALYAGVEFGDNDYPRKPDSLAIIASCGSSGGVVEVWLDSLDTGTMIAACNISGTGSWDITNTFTTPILQAVSGNHDVYLKFTGKSSDKLFMLQWLTFIDKENPTTSIDRLTIGLLPDGFLLEQNYPNPFNPKTSLEFHVSSSELVTIRVLDVLGRAVTTLVDELKAPGIYRTNWDASGLPSGVYFCRMQAGAFAAVRKVLLMK